MPIARTPLIELPLGLRLGGPPRPGEGEGAGAGTGRGTTTGGDTGRPARWLMGIDGGGTKTLAAVLDVQEGRVHLAHGGPSNPDSAGVEAAGAALLASAAAAAQAAGIEPQQIDAAGLAIAGTDTESVDRHVHASAPKSWIVVNDVVGAWATATGLAPGLAVISGTGSNVFGVGADGRCWRAGGWGHVLGDEGSGHWIGVRSLAAALHDRDGSGPPTALSEAALRFYGVGGVQELIALVYGKPLHKSEIAAFGAQTAKLAHAGDEVARAIYRQAAQELAAQARAVVEHSGLQGQFPVGLIGSAFKAGAVFVEPLEERLQQVAPQAQVTVVETAPVTGALMLAAKAGGLQERLNLHSLGVTVERALADYEAGRQAPGPAPAAVTPPSSA